MVSNIQEGHLPRTRNSAFVSSTHIDLVQYREKVRDTLLSLSVPDSDGALWLQKRRAC